MGKKKKPKSRRPNAPAAPAPSAPAPSAPAPEPPAPTPPIKKGPAPPPPIKKEPAFPSPIKTEPEVIVLDDDDKPLLPPLAKKRRRASPTAPTPFAPPTVVPPPVEPPPVEPPPVEPPPAAPPPAAPPSSLHLFSDNAPEEHNAAQSTISNAAAPPAGAQDDDVALCETVVRPDGPAHVVVVSTERQAVAVRCPCERGCGEMVRVGKFAKFARVGSPRCVHCRARVGGDLGFGSYAQLVAHVHTRTCRAVQAAQLARVRRRPAKDRLGKKIVRQINLPKHKSYRDGTAYFTCFRCSKQVYYHKRFVHCVECFGK